LYGLGPDEIRDGLLPIIELPGLKLPHKQVYRRAFDLFVGLRIDWPDAFHAALVERSDEPELYSFDRDFDRVPTIKRFEP
jgi:predicted nucleic acid-binding protein